MFDLYRPGAMEVLVCVKHPFMITHFYHSGFSVAGEHTLLVFDYWRGERGELTPKLQLTPEKLRAYDNVFVFISHEHIDHLDPVVFSWNEAGKRMAPGDTLRLSDEVTVTAFDSTDLGVSFLVDFLGLRFFHAGDLNFWHWREESTMQEIEEADEEFRKAVQPIAREKIDVAFFPVDPRQGTMFEAGANYFILTVKPRILIPMHYFHRADTAMEYARTASCRTTEVLAMPVYGDTIILETDEDGYLNISHPDVIPVRELKETITRNETIADPTEPLLEEDDPFLESDLPLTSLATEKPEPPKD